MPQLASEIKSVQEYKDTDDDDAAADDDNVVHEIQNDDQEQQSLYYLSASFTWQQDSLNDDGEENDIDEAP